MPPEKPPYEVFPPRLNSPRIVTPPDPALLPPDPNTTRRPWSNPSRTPVYGEPQGRPVRDPEPRDRGPNEANDFRPPIIVPGERWNSGDK